LSLEAKIKNDKNFKKRTACVPGFEYSFGLRGEKSGFIILLPSKRRLFVHNKIKGQLLYSKEFYELMMYKSLISLLSMVIKKKLCWRYQKIK